MPSLAVSKVIESLESRAPAGTAERWDNVGLLLGDPAARTAGAVISIDLSAAALKLAFARGFRLIVTHHPCIFPASRGLSRVTASSGGMTSLVHEALRRGVAVAACHTNFDQCALEVVSRVSRGLGATARGRLVERSREALLKLAVFVPAAHADPLREAICAAGAGAIGDYDFCSFGVRGEGTFRGGDSTRPFLGKPGRLERADEVRLETVFPKGLEKQILSAMLRAHPYEEVAYDLYPVEQSPAGTGVNRGLGYGFWGDFGRARPFSEVAKNVTKLFDLKGFLLTEPPPRRIRRIAFVAGKGASFVDAALSAGCELFITGEAGYHTALEGARKGLAVMELGHRESERFFLTTMEGWLREAGLRTATLKQATQKIRS